MDGAFEIAIEWKLFILFPYKMFDFNVFVKLDFVHKP